MADKPQFLARRFENAQRLAAKGYLCPACDESFHAEPKLWAHAKLQHPQALNTADATEDAVWRKQFAHNAKEKAQKNSRRPVRDTEQAVSKHSSNDNDSMEPNIGDVRLRSPQRPTPISGSTHIEEDRIDLAKLTLGQGNIPGSLYDRPTSPSNPNPLKRAVGADAGQPDIDAGVKLDSSKSRARRAKANLGDPYTNQTSDHSQDRPITGDTRDTRASLISNKRLFDPDLDNPTARMKHTSDQTITKRQFDDPLANAIRSGKMPSVDMDDHPIVNFIQGYPTQQQKPMRIMKPIHDSSAMDLDQKSTKEEAAPTATTQYEEMAAGPESEPEPVLLLQPETRPISHDQLVVEVKGIYAGLVLVETKCIDVDEKQSKAAQEKDPARQTKLTNEQWQALIHLHKTLLHEHHDFFLASQHPSASPALSKLAAKYSMPARMWRHGIHAFLEVLRHRLPESLDHMLAFIYIAYSMMALLYETVPTFEDTWIECLGDLGRYRMAIEDDDQRDREVWSGVARFWYSKAADNSPNTGRLYHHLAILARPYTLQQLSFYTRALTCITPFESASSSIMTLFNPILNGKESAYHRSTSMETIFIKAHAILFCNTPVDQFDNAVRQLEDGVLDNYIGRVTSKFKEQGVFAMVANFSALFEYGNVDRARITSPIFRVAYEVVQKRKHDEAELLSQPEHEPAFQSNSYKDTARCDPGDIPVRSQQSPPIASTPMGNESSRVTIACASRLTSITLSISLQRVGDKNVWPLVHVSLVFLWSLTFVNEAMKYVERDVPWCGICSFLNNLAKPEAMTAKIWADAFPHPGGRPLPEDFGIRGQLYSQWYFPDRWFSDATIDDEERTLELPSMTAYRVERILWLGVRIASSDRWITYDRSSQTFKIAQYAAEDLGASPQIGHTGHARGRSRHLSGGSQQPSRLGTRPQELSTVKAPLQNPSAATSKVSDTHDMEIVSNTKIKPENPHNVSWPQAGVRDPIKTPPQNKVPTKLDFESYQLGRCDIYDNATGDLTTN